MPLVESLLPPLIADPIAGYGPGNLPATEPAALACLALSSQGETEAAVQVANWLAAIQSHDGSLGVFPDQGEPAWATAAALIAWQALPVWQEATGHANRIQQAVNWLTGQSGLTYPRQPEVGHDTTIPGWPWVQGTHAWLEPTAWAVMALKCCRLGRHERCRDGIRLLLDRQLPDGGCNFGNTFTLGQRTLPHVQPSAMALLALQGESAESPLSHAVAYLQREWPALQGVISICWAAVALTAYGARPADVEERLRSSWERAEDRLGGYHRALGILALTTASPLIGLTG